MCSVTLITLLASVAQAYDANLESSAAAHKNNTQASMDLDNFVQNLVDKLVDRANTHFQNAEMDTTTLGKPGNLAAAPSWSNGEEATEGTPSDQPHAFLIEDVIEPASDGTLVEEETVLPLVLGLRGGAKKAPMATMKASPMAAMKKAAMAKTKKAPMAKSSKVGVMLGLEGGMAKKAPMAKTAAMKAAPMAATKKAAMAKAKKAPMAKSSNVGMMLGLEGGMAKKAPMAKMAAMKAAPMKKAAMKAMKAPMAAAASKSPRTSVPKSPMK